MTIGTQPAKRSVPALVAFGLCIVGVLIPAYLTYEHFTDSTTLACSDSGTVNCLKVTTSQWSVIAGVPVAVAGLAFFLAMTLLCASTRWARDTALLRLIRVVAGVVMVLWLVYVEIFKVDAICLRCTGSTTSPCCCSSPSCGGGRANAPIGSRNYDSAVESQTIGGYRGTCVW